MEQNWILNRILKARKGCKKERKKCLEAVTEDLRKVGIEYWEKRKQKHLKKLSEVLRHRMRKSIPRSHGPKRPAATTNIFVSKFLLTLLTALMSVKQNKYI